MDEKLIRSIGTKRPCREKCTPPDKRPKFNENQQIVLDTLKDDSLGSSPFFTIWHTMENNQLFNGKGMTVRQQFEVLASFAEWGMENEQED